VRELAQLDVRPLRLPEGLGHELRRHRVALLQRHARQLQRHDRVDQALLRPVEEIPHQPAPLLVRGGREPRP
jgi:hypothetical protein